VANAREIQAMRLAMALSAHGLGTTSPNPPVGCVILNANGEIVGTGYHRRKGEPHAEVHALTAAGRRAKGGTAIVTLEPCNHVGRTPACRQELIEAGITRVVIAVIDPTSRGEGGAALLRSAGVDVEVGVLADEVRLVLGPWLIAQARGWPFVIAGYAMGKEGAVPLEPHAMSELRAGVDAVLHEGGRVEEAAAGTHGYGVLDLPATIAPTDPTDLLRRLYGAGVRLLLLAGGPGFLDVFIDTVVVDRLVVDWLVAPDASGKTCAEVTPNGYLTGGVTKIPSGLRIEYAPENK
jgi:diaminohydroxyphosphoribosylaminopyrimidine deaminase / 5-amino-6-(5-phosphoribosylamino)uracil reductase